VNGERDQGERDEAQERQSFVRHELRTPLAVMRPLVDMLLEDAGGLDERRLGYLRMLDRNLERLSAMIASVADTGWLEAAAVPAADEAVQVGPLVEETARDVRGSHVTAPRVETEVADDLPPVWGDRHRLRRALRDVLVNACTFTPVPGTVEVTAAPAPGDAVAIVVVDTGCGIPADEIDAVCDFGFQGEAGRARDGRGIGLGLFVARRVVEDHGGSLSIESAVGEGTRVTILLPAGTQ
jgi:signal transduction histidine kinase